MKKKKIAEVVNFKIGGRDINNLRLASDMANTAKTPEELQDMANRLVDTGRKYGMEITSNESI